jgi:hypothetical protein
MQRRDRAGIEGGDRLKEDQRLLAGRGTADLNHVRVLHPGDEARTGRFVLDDEKLNHLPAALEHHFGLELLGGAPQDPAHLALVVHDRALGGPTADLGDARRGGVLEQREEPELALVLSVVRRPVAHHVDRGLFIPDEHRRPEQLGPPQRRRRGAVAQPQGASRLRREPSFGRVPRMARHPGAVDGHALGVVADTLEGSDRGHGSVIPARCGVDRGTGRRHRIGTTTCGNGGPRSEGAGPRIWGVFPPRCRLRPCGPGPSLRALCPRFGHMPDATSSTSTDLEPHTGAPPEV